MFVPSRRRFDYWHPGCKTRHRSVRMGVSRMFEDWSPGTTRSRGLAETTTDEFAAWKKERCRPRRLLQMSPLAAQPAALPGHVQREAASVQIKDYATPDIRRPAVIVWRGQVPYSQDRRYDVDLTRLNPQDPCLHAGDPVYHRQIVSDRVCTPVKFLLLNIILCPITGCVTGFAGSTQPVATDPSQGIQELREKCPELLLDSIATRPSMP